MSKFIAKFYSSSDRSNGYTIGKYEDKEKAAEAAWNYAHNNYHTSGCDVKEKVIEALVSRDFYMIAYGPREIEIEEVAS